MTAAPSLTPRGTTATGGKVRVLIVDDSVVIRHLLREALQIEMPQMDGLTVLRHIRKGYPRLRTVMFSTLTTRGAAATLEALSLGADDYVAKASNGGKLDESLASLRAELLPKIRQFFATAGTGRPHRFESRRQSTGSLKSRASWLSAFLPAAPMRSPG